MAGETETYAFRKFFCRIIMSVCVFVVLLVGRVLSMGACEIWAGRVGSAGGGGANSERGSA